MNYILPFIIGFLAAFIGLLAPSMLNMTAARTSIEKGKKAGITFAAGAASVVFIQGFLAVTFAKYLVAHPEVITKLKTAAVFVLFGLAIFFFMQARKKFKAEGKQKKGSNYLTGLGMSSLNMLAIPFYLAMATLAENKGWMTIEKPFSIIYVVGAVLGAFSLFSIYASFAEIIAKKAQFIAKNINYILSVLFVVLALLTLIKLLM
jgi:threonine/homoserine/homoserine lactone efflux protein